MKRQNQTINLFLIILFFIEAIWAYSRLPERVATHWNAQGQVDGYMGRFGGTFFVPLLVLGIYLLFLIIPRIDPKRKNIAQFIDIFNRFITALLLFMLYIYSLTIVFNLGYTFDFTKVILPAFGALFYFIGWMLPKAKPNWFIGIRTPWTLSNDEVWVKTHMLGGKLFKISGVLVFLGLLLSKYAYLFVLVPIIVSSIYTVVYSYLEYKRIEKNN
jgi:uncharacterized membrane protein